MPNTNITYEEIDRVATALTTGQGQLNDILTGLKGQVDGLISDGFTTDTASGQFDGAYQEFTTGVTHVLEGLSEMSQFLHSVSSAYQDMDQSIASKISR